MIRDLIKSTRTYKDLEKQLENEILEGMRKEVRLSKLKKTIKEFKGETSNSDEKRKKDINRLKKKIERLETELLIEISEK